MVYTYCNLNLNLIKIYIKESVTDIMKDPVLHKLDTFQAFSSMGPCEKCESKGK